MPGLQSIHTIKVDDSGDLISAVATQQDFAVINTSTDLSSYGRFALDPELHHRRRRRVGLSRRHGRQPIRRRGGCTQDRGLSDIDTSNLPLSAGYSGGPVRDNLYTDGRVIPAVVGTVSTMRMP